MIYKLPRTIRNPNMQKRISIRFLPTRKSRFYNQTKRRRRRRKGGKRGFLSNITKLLLYVGDGFVACWTSEFGEI